MKTCRDYTDVPPCCVSCHEDADEFWPEYPLCEITDSTGEQAEVCCVVAEALRKRSKGGAARAARALLWRHIE